MTFALIYQGFPNKSMFKSKSVEVKNTAPLLKFKSLFRNRSTSNKIPTESQNVPIKITNDTKSSGGSDDTNNISSFLVPEDCDDLCHGIENSVSEVDNKQEFLKTLN